MAGDTVITVIGNITGDPELRFTPSGAAVCNFTVAHTPRSYDRNSSQWKDGETNFWRCAAWRDLAEHIAESCERGTSVILYGTVTSRSYETKQGEKRTTMEVTVEHLGPDLSRASAKVTKAAQRSKSQDGGWGDSQAREGTVHTPPAGGWGDSQGWGRQ